VTTSKDVVAVVLSVLAGVGFCKLVSLAYHGLRVAGERWRWRRARLGVDGVNVIGGLVLPLPEDVRWRGSDREMSFGGGGHLLIEVLGCGDRLFVGKMQIPYSAQVDRYCRAVLAAGRQRRMEDLSREGFMVRKENCYCSFCGRCRVVVGVGEVASGEDNVDVYICSSCTSDLVAFWKSLEVVKTESSGVINRTEQ
jgi:hypothetical protein